jgi:glycosyltransferase involved in cell wall biosynthesis
MHQDLDLLKKHFSVKVVNVCFDVRDLKGTLMTPVRLIAGVIWADVLFCWAANRDTFVAVAVSQLFNKKTVVAVGGADVTAIPELGYGAALRKTAHFFQMAVLHRAVKVLPDSKDAEKGALDLLNNSAKVTLIYLGIDVEKFHPSGTKVDKVITVSVVSRSNLKRKGLETFVKSAAYLPNVEFLLIGDFLDDSINYLRSIASRNIKFTGFVTESELVKYYQQAKVYVQVSAHEAFGASLAEAMASGCVPVVTDKGAIPEVVGNTGIYVPYGDPEATAAGVLKALKSDTGKLARQRIDNCFSSSKREVALWKTITEL